MTVWNRARGTIEQFAKAIASEPGELAAEEIYYDILREIWSGEFDGRMYLSEGVKAPPDNDDSWTRPWTRDGLRDAMMGCIRSNPANWIDRDPRQDPIPPFEWIRTLRPDEYNKDFRFAYLDKLYIATNAIKEWRSRTAPSAAEAAATVPAHPPLAIRERPLSSPPPADPWQALIDGLPERDLVKMLAKRPAVARAVVAILVLFRGDRPTTSAPNRLDRINAFLTEHSQERVQKDSVRLAYNEIENWPPAKAAQG